MNQKNKMAITGNEMPEEQQLLGLKELPKI
jgi:hypothetical protein